jgi:hypothetical protein
MEMARSNTSPKPFASTTNRLGKRVWNWIVILTVLVFLWPVSYRTTRLALVAGLGLAWAGALVLWWDRRWVRGVLLLAVALPAAGLGFSSRAVDSDSLAEEYVRSLRAFRGVRYIWGGESSLGIDCSGLVRKGMIWGQLRHGLRTFNGRPLRSALALWWYDCTAEAMRDSYRGWTLRLFESRNVEDVDCARLHSGDLAVTTDGVHIMAYLGNRTWIEADPEAQRVLEVSLPANNKWFKVPVIFLRWQCLVPPASVPRAQS